MARTRLQSGEQSERTKAAKGLDGRAKVAARFEGFRPASEVLTEVRAVETGPQALDLLKRQRFDMMLSDVVMPGGMTGIELARQCGRDYPEMRVVLTSGYAGEDVDAALANAPWPFLRKPYSGEQLARILGELS